MSTKPPVCPDCHREPWDCPSCGDYRCACPNPFQVQAWQAARADNPGAKRPRLLGSKHYAKDGKPYEANYLDGYQPEPYPDDDTDTQWLIEGGLT